MDFLEVSFARFWLDELYLFFGPMLVFGVWEPETGVSVPFDIGKTIFNFFSFFVETGSVVDF